MRIYTLPTLVLIIVTFLSFLGFGFILPLWSLYARTLGSTGFQIGLMASAALVTGLFATPLAGWLSDRVGPRRVLLVALFLHGIVTLSYISVHSTGWLLILRGLEGITAAGIFPPVRALMNRSLPRERQGEALGVLSAARSSGILFGPAVGSFLANFVSYRASFLIAAVTLLIASLTVALFVRKPTHEKPIQEVHQKNYAEAFAAPLTLPYALAFALGIPVGVASAVWSIYMQDRGAALSMIGLSYTTFALPGLFVSPLVGRWSDRTGRYPFILTGVLFSACIYSIYALPLSPLWIVGISVLEGLAATIARSAADGLLADMMIRGMEGRIQAVYITFATAGNLVGTVTGGALYDRAPGLPFVGEGLILLVIGCLLLIPRIRLAVSMQTIK